jgi:hypothetical protein
VGQTFPQAPQFATSLFVSLHIPEQHVSPGPQSCVGEHPATHAWVAEQRVPGAQLASARQATQACAAVSQSGAPGVPAQSTSPRQRTQKCVVTSQWGALGAMLQSASAPQPLEHVRVAASQYFPALQPFFDATHSTHAPVVTSHTEPRGSPAQSPSIAQVLGASTAPLSGPGALEPSPPPQP